MNTALLTAAAAAGLLMVAGCFVPRHRLPARLPHDSVLHVSAFLLLALPIPALTPDMAGRWLLGGALYTVGVLIEVAQCWVPNRRFGADDTFYNGLGILAGIALGQVFQTVG